MTAPTPDEARKGAHEVVDDVTRALTDTGLRWPRAREVAIRVLAEPAALLAALGHTDCVPREEYDRVDDEEWMARVRSGDQARRAERAEQRLRTIHGLAYGALPEASGEALDGGDAR